MNILSNHKSRKGQSIAAIMPLYNKRKYVIDAVESILQQTLPADEIIIVDDGSTDGSGDLVAERYGNEPKVRLIRQTNHGIGAATNVAIQATRAPLLAFLDADDKWLPQKLERQGGFMEKNPACMMSFSGSIGYNEQSGETWYKPLGLLKHIKKDQFIRQDFFPEKVHIATNSVMIRREALDDVGLFDESFFRFVHTDLWLRIMLRFGFEYIPEHLVWVRRGFPRSVEEWEHIFKGTDQYFAKHRYSFGRGLHGWVVWRAGYASVRRGDANWFFRHRMGRKALFFLIQAICLWPFFNPKWVIKSSAEYLLGTDKYDKISRRIRKLLGDTEKPAGQMPLDD